MLQEEKFAVESTWTIEPSGRAPARYRGDSTSFGFQFTTTQDNGTLEEARFVMLPEAGLSVVAPRGQTLAFAVSPYSPTEQLLTT